MVSILHKLSPVSLSLLLVLLVLTGDSRQGSEQCMIEGNRCGRCSSKGCHFCFYKKSIDQDGSLKCGETISIPHCAVTYHANGQCAICDHGYMLDDKYSKTTVCKRSTIDNCIQGHMYPEDDPLRRTILCSMCRTGYTLSVDKKTCEKNGEGETYDGCLVQYKMLMSSKTGQILTMCRYCGKNRLKQNYNLCEKKTCQEGCEYCDKNNNCIRCQNYLNYYEYEKGRCRYMAPPPGVVNILVNPNATIPEDDPSQSQEESKNSKMFAFFFIFALIFQA